MRGGLIAAGVVTMALIGWACETGNGDDNPNADPPRPAPTAGAPVAPVNPRGVPSPQHDPHEDNQYDVEFHATWDPPGLTMRITWTAGSKGDTLEEVYTNPWAITVPGLHRGALALLTVAPNEAQPSYLKCWITIRGEMAQAAAGPFTNPGEVMRPNKGSCNATAVII